MNRDKPFEPRSRARRRALQALYQWQITGQEASEILGQFKAVQDMNGVDEAYFEFSNSTIANLVPSCPNLIVLRTFSKWAGLAGLRIGYGFFPIEIAGYLMKIKQPYNANAAAQAAEAQRQRFEAARLKLAHEVTSAYAEYYHLGRRIAVVRDNMELVRLAFPRRVYTQSHVDYLAEVLLHVNTIKTTVRGVRITDSPPVLRHFTARLEPAHGSLFI